MDVRTPLTAKERDQLEALMEAKNPDGPIAASITRLHGFFSSVVSGPMILPSEWMPVIFGDADENAWERIDEAQSAMGLVMRFYNEVVSALQTGDGYAIMIDRIGDGPDAMDIADDWCNGYVLGTSLREDEWKEAIDAEELAACFLPILVIPYTDTVGLDSAGDVGQYNEFLGMLPGSVVEIYEWWRNKLFAPMPGYSRQGFSRTIRRVDPKVSPNAPCPCGSGKKAKRCCAGFMPH